MAEQERSGRETARQALANAQAAVRAEIESLPSAEAIAPEDLTAVAQTRGTLEGALWQIEEALRRGYHAEI